MKWLSDTHIKSHIDDKLKFDTAVDTLKNRIVHSDTPLSIGINGKWGTGKSSMMGLIKEKLDCENDIQIRTHWFDTWNYANEKEIWRILMLSLMDELEPENKTKVDIKKLISSILGIGSITSKALLSQGISLLSEKENIEQTIDNLSNIQKSREEIIIREQIKSVRTFRVEFEEIVKGAVGDEGKFVIFIDDLDRIIPDKVVEVIEAIKTFLDCKRCIFVIGCDYDYLDMCIGKRYAEMNLSGRDYLEKIIQIPFNVPSIDESQFNIFLHDLLPTSFDVMEDFEMAGKLITNSIGRNPRKIKRLVNLYYILEDLNINNELDNLLLFKLLCFLTKWPDSHKNLVEAFYKGENKFNQYEEWAFPKQEYYEYSGFYDPDEYTMPAEQLEGPPDPEEEYDRYIKHLDAVKKQVDKEIQKKENDSDDELLKRFFRTAPLFPDAKTLGSHIALIETIDTSNIETKGNLLTDNMSSIEKMDGLVKKVIGSFNGQNVNGKYFNVSSYVILPIKSIENKKIPMPIWREYEIGDWRYKVIKNRYELKKDMIERMLQNCKICWIISPWNFPKSIIDFAEKNGNIYLTKSLQLDELIEELK